jgi:hypothetical protein
VGIHQLLHSFCYFLNTNTAITWQLIGTARTLEAEWWQVCGEAWVQGQRKMSQVLGAFGLLDFTMLRPGLAWRAFLNLWTIYFFNFPNFFSGHCQPRILNLQIRRSACTVTQNLYFLLTVWSNFCSVVIQQWNIMTHAVNDTTLQTRKQNNRHLQYHMIITNL